MSTALYRLYRPQKFMEVEGQTSAVDVLIKSISTGRAAHAYLFSGARGCGKTTVARLTAKALNCASPADNYEPCCKCSNCVSIAGGDNLDVIEIDGASNNGVEEIRELKSHVSLAPFNSRFKVYIIDEVHMLSTAAFNALLKTLEEPPEYVVFILATTEPHKIPVTIRSRCQHIPFHRIRAFDILHRLEYVCNKEVLEYENEALWEIARQADGALRDALSLLDQVMSFGKGVILLDDVSNLVGGGSLIAIQRWLSAWRRGGEESFLQLNDMFQRGASPQRVIEELFYISRNLWIAREFGHECVKKADVSKEEYDYIVEEYKSWDSKSLERLMLFLAKLLPQARVGMRADVIVGVLLSRRLEIIENSIDGISPKAITDTAIKPEVPFERKTKRSLPIESNLSANEVKENIDVNSEDRSAKPDPHLTLTKPIDTFQYNQNDLLEIEKYKPFNNETRHKFLTSLKSSDFSIFCALLDAEFFHNSEQNKVCIIVKHDYLFHFTTSERNSLILVHVIREEFPECILKIVYGNSVFEYSGINVAIPNKNSIKEANKSEPKVSDLVPPDNNAEKTGSVLYDAAHEAMKFMRGEIVMHRIASEKPEEIDVS